MKKNTILLGLALVFGGALVGGCTDQAREKYESAGDAAGKAAQRTGDAVATDARETGEAVEQGVENAGEAVEEIAQKAGQAVDNATMTLNVKNAILTAENLEARDVNVDTVGNRVVLKGSVPSQENKRRAEQIAKAQAGNEFSIDNQLTVRGGGDGGAGRAED